uniref:Uncharacterized protein n=1 Tax=Anguilla anguilla TaxID=7936 RepID=A0A0E9TDD4_ANGAN
MKTPSYFPRVLQKNKNLEAGQRFRLLCQSAACSPGTPVH